ncbi:uncharacterized protein TrAFT101_005298 [Trichoderma asperellum]|uniref:uncharacterized protein n=1 Tax=Trichoderma asperellum TaxID=101201 RepID=UPI00332472D6|nr:hypothetical protein TrAFT101_005298 [Trichoderma asperellum]
MISKSNKAERDKREEGLKACDVLLHITKAQLEKQDWLYRNTASKAAINTATSSSRRAVQAVGNFNISQAISVKLAGQGRLNIASEAPSRLANSGLADRRDLVEPSGRRISLSHFTAASLNVNQICMIKQGATQRSTEATRTSVVHR